MPIQSSKHITKIYIHRMVNRMERWLRECSTVLEPARLQEGHSYSWLPLAVDFVLHGCLEKTIKETKIAAAFL